MVTRSLDPANNIMFGILIRTTIGEKNKGRKVTGRDRYRLITVVLPTFPGFFVIGASNSNKIISNSSFVMRRDSTLS